MITSVLKAIAKGIFIGASLFFFPHIILTFFLFFGLMRLFVGGKMRNCHRNSRFDFMDRIRKMSEEEYEKFKTQKMTCC